MRKETVVTIEKGDFDEITVRNDKGKYWRFYTGEGSDSSTFACLAQIAAAMLTSTLTANIERFTKRRESQLTYTLILDIED